MRNVIQYLATGSCLMILHAVPAAAHHSFSMYDMGKTMTLHGQVSRFQWQAPHTHIFITVKAGEGNSSPPGEYDIEGPAPNILGRQGWNKLSLKPGDRVTLTAHPMRENNKSGALVLAVLNGVTMYPDTKRPAVPADAVQKAPAK